jgi:uncharacterized OB-fold protein
MRFDLPAPQDDTEPFWAAARAHRLVVRRDRRSGRHFFYPRAFDPQTWSADVEWVEVSGRATLHTYSVVRQNDLPPWPSRVPYVVAIVELEEGPRLMTNIVGCEPGDLEIGMPLVVAWEERSGELTVPVFRPA